MIKLVIGRSGSGKSTLVEHAVKDIIDNTDKAAVVIVPEQETVEWESRLANTLPASANLRLEVTNFTRLPNSVFREFGGLADSLADDGTELLITWRAMASVWDELHLYNRVKSREDRCVPTFKMAIEELKGNGITPEMAEKAYEQMSEDQQNDEIIVQIDTRKSGGGLADRLHDAALVYSAYNAILHEDFVDRQDVEQKLAESIAKNPYFKGKAAFIDSFMSFTAGQEKVIREILRTADDTTITFMTPCSTKANQTKFDISDDSNNEETPTQEQENQPDEIQFYEPSRQLKKIIAICSRLGKEVEIINLGENLRHKDNPTMKLLERRLFDYSYNVEEINEISNPEDDNVWHNVQIIRCEDKYDEAKAVSAIVAKLLREGYQPRDIAIAAHDISKYDGIVDTELRRHGVDCEISHSTGVMLNPVIIFVQSALSVIANGWRKEDIICLLESGLVSIKTSGEDELEKFSREIFCQYITLWNINSRRMYTGDDWSMNPDGYKIGITQYGERILKIVNNVKNSIATPLETLAQVFDEAETDVKKGAGVRRIAESIVRIAEEVDLINNLKRMAERRKELGMESEKCLSGWRICCEILDKMVDILGECELDAARFLGLFKRIAATLDVGSIPEGNNEITLGSALGLRLGGKKCIIILGANEGEFPGIESENKTFFADRDKAELESYGLVLSEADSNLKVSREYLTYYRAVSSAEERLYVLCDENAEMSEGAKRISEITGCEIMDFRDFPIVDKVYDEYSAETYLLNKGYSFTEFKNSLNSTNDINAKDEPAITEELNLPIGQKMILSQTKIETYLRCPFSYACRYELLIKPRPKSELTLPDVGEIVHKILQLFFVKNTVRGEVKIKIDSDEISKEVDRIIDFIKAEYRKSVGEIESRYEYLYTRIRKHTILFIKKILYELDESHFKPISFEKKIGSGGLTPISFESEDGNTVTLGGKIDRIDILEDENNEFYVRVVDFKTGNKVFNIEKMNEGNGIQLLIYLFSLVMNGEYSMNKNNNLKIGGGLYISSNLTSPTTDPGMEYTEVEQLALKNIKISGIMNEELENNNKSIIQRDEKGFDEVYNDLCKIITSICDEITRKEFPVAPKMIDGRLPCEWCENGYICKYRGNIWQE